MVLFVQLSQRMQYSYKKIIILTQPDNCGALQPAPAARSVVCPITWTVSQRQNTMVFFKKSEQPTKILKRFRSTLLSYLCPAGNSPGISSLIYWTTSIEIRNQYSPVLAPTQIQLKCCGGYQSLPLVVVLLSFKTVGQLLIRIYNLSVTGVIASISWIQWETHYHLR